MTIRRRKRKSRAAQVAAFRRGDSRAANREAIVLRVYCRAKLSAEDYDALVVKLEALGYQTPWERVKFWGDALERAHAPLLS